MTAGQKRHLLYATAAVLIALAVIQWVLLPMIAYRENLTKRQERAEQRLLELRALGQKLAQAEQQSRQETDSEAKPADFTLFSFLEKQATEDGVKDSVEYMRPLTEERNGRAQEKVQIRLEPIRLAKLASFLAHVELAPEGVFVERMTIRSPRQDPGRLRVDLVFATFI